MAGYTRFTRQTLTAVASSVTIYLRNLLLIPVLTRHLGREEYGVWVQVLACSELLLGLAALGFGFSLTRFFQSRQDQGRLAGDVLAILILVGVSGTLLGVAGIVASESISEAFLGGAARAVYLKVLFLFLPVSALQSVVLAYFRAARQITTHSLFHVAESLLYILAALWCVQLGWGIWAVLGALVATRTATLLVATGMLLRQTGWGLPDFGSMWEYLRYGLPVVPLGLFNWINNASDRFVIAGIDGVESTAVYAISYGIGSLAGFFFSPIYFVLYPSITQLWERGDLPAVREHFLYAQKYPLLVAIPFLVVMSWHADLIVGTVATPAYATDGALILLVGAGILFMNLGSLVVLAIGLVKKTGTLPIFYLICSLVNLGGNVVAVGTLGIRGAAIMTAVTYLLQALLMLGYARRHYDFPVNTGFMVRALAAVAPMVLVLAVIPSGSLLAGFLGVATATAAFLLTLLALRAFEMREWRLLRSVVGW